MNAATLLNELNAIRKEKEVYAKMNKDLKYPSHEGKGRTYTKGKLTASMTIIEFVK